MTVTMKDVFLMAVPIAAAHTANPCNSIGMHNEATNKEALNAAIKTVIDCLSERGIHVTTDPFQEAVISAANESHIKL